MDFLSSAGRAFKKVLKGTADTLKGVGYVVAVKMPSDVVDVITKGREEEETEAELNFTLERLGVLSGGRRATPGKLAFYITLPDPSESPPDEPHTLLTPAATDACILADDGRVIGRQSYYSASLWYISTIFTSAHNRSASLPRKP